MHVTHYNFQIYFSQINATATSLGTLVQVKTVTCKCYKLTPMEIFNVSKYSSTWTKEGYHNASDKTTGKKSTKLKFPHRT